MTVALVVGCAEGVWEDVEEARKLGDYDAFYVCKMAGIQWDEGFFHWMTLHPEFMAGYKEERKKLGLPDSYEVTGPLKEECGMHGAHPLDRRVSYRWPEMTSSGSTGLFAVKVALDTDGHHGIVLAGVPMTSTNHFLRGKPWPHRDSFIPAWEKAQARIKDRVRSVSGWTREMLGAPTREWVALMREATGDGRDAHNRQTEGSDA